MWQCLSHYHPRPPAVLTNQLATLRWRTFLLRAKRQVRNYKSAQVCGAGCSVSMLN
jgi:hypothetical protein